MLGAATPELAVNVSHAGGMGFIAGGNNPENLDKTLSEAAALVRHPLTNKIKRRPTTLPIGVGFQLFNSPMETSVDVIAKHKPAAVWLFAPKVEDEYHSWSKRLRAKTDGSTSIWLQVGSVHEMMLGLSLANPDVLVMQGTDAGGHGQRQSASIISLIPEAVDRLQQAGHHDMPVLAAGGIVDARGFAAAQALGASGAVMGSRFLVADECSIAKGWKQQLLDTHDGGVSTTRSTLCDRLKETKGWPKHYDGRAISNQGHADDNAGMSDAENIRLYTEELKRGEGAWNVQGRMVAYAGTGVGLIKRTEPVACIVDDIQSNTRRILEQSAGVLAADGEQI